MKNISILFIFLMMSLDIFAQNTNITLSGTIEFEKTANMYVLITKMFDKAGGTYAQDPVEKFKKTQTQFRHLKSTLVFNQNKQLYTPLAGQINAFDEIETPMAQQNSITYTDFLTHKIISEKNVFRKVYLVNDDVAKIKWKLTDETRDIAGYSCRRANGIILDSIYVVAFFTNRIPVSGGPETFRGLPGMILGVVLPHENITWFATRIVESSIADSEILPPNIGDKIDRNGFIDKLTILLKNMGSTAQYFFKAFML
jgi:GLPGLI family protein